MVIGITLFKFNGNPFYSPEFGRGGLAATLAVDVTHTTSLGFLVTVQTRNTEDTTWTSLGSFAVITADGVETKDLAGFKEVVRFAYTFDGGDGPTDGVHFLMQAPSWRPY